MRLRNGAIEVTERDGQQFVRVISGTSFAAPQIAGAAALLRQAFPNLTAADTVDLLLRGGRDAGAAGTDAVYGRGILDIASAFAPQGQTTLAGTTTAVALAESTGTVSPAMGDAGRSTALNAVVLDGYGRAYGVDLGGSLRSAGVAPRLAGALIGRTRDLSAGASGVTLALSAERAAPQRQGAALLPLQEDARSRVLAAQMIAQVLPAVRVGFAVSGSGDTLAAALRGNSRPAFLLAGSPTGDAGFSLASDTAFGLRRQLGSWGLTVTADRGMIREDSALDQVRRGRRKDLGAASRFGAQIDRRSGRLDLALGASWLDERRTVLGALFNRALAPKGAHSLFLDLDATFRPADGWRLGAALRQGWTRPRDGGILATGSGLAAQAWSIDLARDGVFAAGDSLALRIAQPMRVISGGLLFDLPTGYDYATLTATSSREHLSLVSRGREMIGELAWRGVLWGGYGSTSLFYRKDPGHFAGTTDDAGVAMTWTGSF